jgi:predicted deacylase
MPHLDSIEVAAQVDESAESLAQMDVPPEAETLPVFDLNLPVSKAQIEPGSLVKTTWAAGESLHGAPISTPVLIAKGRQEGPTLCVTAAVHGDELNGIESVRRLMYSIDTGKLKGMVMGVPIVNLQGFQRHSRYLADRRDLNRFFPGNPRGSSASRMAYGFFNEVIRKCDGLVDLHTGSFHRTNLPQLRADLNNTEVLKLTKGFGATTILHSTGGQGTLRRAAVDAGIPAVTLEAGEPLRLQQDAVEHTVKAVFTLLDALEMYEKRSLWGNPEPTYYSSAWVRADQGGILMSDVKLGKKVKSGDELGTIIDPISNEQVQILAPFTGRVIGMAVNQFVMPGYAAFHIATEAELDKVSEGDDYHTEGLDVAVSDSLGDDRSE